MHLKMFKISADTALNRVSRYKEGRRLMVEHYSNVSFPLQHSLWPIVEDASQCYPLELLFTPRRKSFFIQKTSFIQQLICNLQNGKISSMQARKKLSSNKVASTSCPMNKDEPVE